MQHSEISQKYTRAIFVPAAIGSLVGSAEQIFNARQFFDNGLLRSTLPDYQEKRQHFSLNRILKTPQAAIVLNSIGFITSASMLAFPNSRKASITYSCLITATHRLLEKRTPYGRDGADQMTSIITQYRILSALIEPQTKSDEIFFDSVNFQLALAYFAAGVSKLSSSSWIQGGALEEILRTETYGNGVLARHLKQKPRLCKCITWLTIAWETAFPSIYFMPEKYAKICLMLTKCFHVGVAGTMELSRFYWGFAAAHGAAKYTFSRRRQ